MTTETFITMTEMMNSGEKILCGSEVHRYMGQLLAPEKHRGQEASGVSPISNHRRKRLCKQKA